MTLYELTGEYADLQEQLATAADDDQIDAILDAMGAVECDIATKAVNYAKVQRNLQCMVDGFDAEIKRLTARKKALEHAITQSKGRVFDAMKALGLTKLDAGIGRFGIQKNPPGCEILDEAKIPAQYRIPQPDKIDTRAIIAAWRETGQQTEGAKVEQKEGLRFR